MIERKVGWQLGIVSYAACQRVYANPFGLNGLSHHE